ncbi:MAG: hypothetical protein GEU80_07900 [Dehalococcoidia bacterium]|nr:hypothetical protein [Dehalococcoidia bacterium]
MTTTSDGLENEQAEFERRAARAPAVPRMPEVPAAAQSPTVSTPARARPAALAFVDPSAPTAIGAVCSPDDPDCVAGDTPAE